MGCPCMTGSFTNAIVLEITVRLTRSPGCRWAATVIFWFLYNAIDNNIQLKMQHIFEVDEQAVKSDAPG